MNRRLPGCQSIHDVFGTLDFSLTGIPEIDRQRLSAAGADTSIDQIADIAETPRLQAVAEDGNRFPLSADHETGTRAHHSFHARLGVEDTPMLVATPHP